jgi:hypothetical protein
MSLLSDVGREQTESYLLGAHPITEVLAILAAAAGGEPEINPVGYAVTMPGIAGRTAGEASGVDTGLGQKRLNAVGGRPIDGDLP